jgi:hypothetical protein
MAVSFKINEFYVKQIALAIVSHIRARTLSGFDKDGKPFKPYSTNTFAMPRAAVNNRTYATLRQANKLDYFKRDGMLFVAVKGGYKDYKAAKRPGDGGKVNLTDTGQMLRALTVLEASNNKIKIGFSAESEAKKMEYNLKYGRDILGVTDKELNEIVEKFSLQPDFWELNIN